MKYGNLNFLEPSGPLQACNGTALPLPLVTELSKLVKGRQKRQKERRDVLSENLNQEKILNLVEVGEKTVIRKSVAS
jgi:hypothetical protein